jgi:hypothetical protein
VLQYLENTASPYWKKYDTAILEKNCTAVLEKILHCSSEKKMYCNIGKILHNNIGTYLENILLLHFSSENIVLQYLGNIAL